MTIPRHRSLYSHPKKPAPSVSAQVIVALGISVVVAAAAIALFLFMRPGASAGASVGGPASPKARPASNETRTWIAPAGRSPMPRPGESFEHPIAPKRLAPPAPPRPLPDSGIVPWDAARHYVGQQITLEGKIVSTNNIGSVCFLNFTEQWKDRFYVVLLRKALSGWPRPPEEHFLNKTVRVKGTVALRGSRPQIAVEDPAQIQIVPLGASEEATTRPATAGRLRDEGGGRGED